MPMFGASACCGFRRYGSKAMYDYDKLAENDCDAEEQPAVNVLEEDGEIILMSERCETEGEWISANQTLDLEAVR